MNDENKSPESQGDFFDQLMFGPPRPMPRNEQEIDQSNQATEASSQTDPNNEQFSNQETSQLEHIIQIAQVVGPYLSKLSPMLSNLQSFFTNKK
ncbi:hypothetical protein [Alkalihalobacterium elongatum]|uniref:hypothetical protein n=1 Tax=Alkalihalobacterium elongatum TaxID=2675466 RepID=UPI001C200B4E|nr:hypothetical protein [Alkalihalobacterium elongatum]